MLTEPTMTPSVSTLESDAHEYDVEVGDLVSPDI
jgi:hypothetical protein